MRLSTLKRTADVLSAKTLAWLLLASCFFLGFSASRGPSPFIGSVSAPSPNAFFVPLVVEDPEFYTNLGLNNLSDSEAAVKISLVNQLGSEVDSRTVSVPPHGMLQINHVVSYLTSEPAVKDGYLILEGNQDIRAWASLIDQHSLDPSVMLASSETASQVLIPSSVANARYSSRLIVLNTSPMEGTVRVSIRDEEGKVLAVRDALAIASNGMLHFGDIYEAMGIGARRVAGVFGPIEIEASAGLQLQAVLHIYSNEHTGGFLTGVNRQRGARDLILPYARDSADFRYNLGLNNLGTLPATVTLRLIGSDGGERGSSQFQLPPNSLTQLNDALRLLAVPGSREGWIRAVADQDIFAWGSLIDNHTQDPALTVAEVRGATKWLIPSATSAGSFKSSLAVANLAETPAQVELRARNGDGAMTRVVVMTLPGSGWLFSPDILQALGLAGQFGPLEITSLGGKPLITASQVFSERHTGSAFTAVPLEPLRQVLYLTLSAGFEHGVLPLSEGVLRDLGERSRAFRTTVSKDPSLISRESLRDFDAIVFYTTGELPLSDAQKQAFLDFVRSGKAFIGIHSATDTFYQWPEYGDLIGAYFDGHPWHQEVAIETEDPTHAATRHLTPSFRITDEIYQFRNFSTDKLHVLLRLDNRSVDLNAPGVNRPDRFFALAWTRLYGSGRVFYTALGHREEVWQDSRFQQHLLNGMRWAIGDVR